MFRPMIYAPMPSPNRLAKSLSGPVVPPVCPCISRNARVPTYQPCSSSPPTPSGCSSPWRGPAPYPSSEIAKLCTRTLDMLRLDDGERRRPLPRASREVGDVLRLAAVRDGPLGQLHDRAPRRSVVHVLVRGQALAQALD